RRVFVCLVTVRRKLLACEDMPTLHEMASDSCHLAALQIRSHLATRSCLSESHALVSFARVLFCRRLLRKLRPALRLGCARAHVSDPVRLAPFPRAVVVAGECPIWAVQSRRRLHVALARWRLPTAERAARGRLRPRPRRDVAAD